MLDVNPVKFSQSSKAVGKYSRLDASIDNFWRFANEIVVLIGTTYLFISMGRPILQSAPAETNTTILQSDRFSKFIDWKRNLASGDAAWPNDIFTDVELGSHFGEGEAVGLFEGAAFIDIQINFPFDLAQTNFLPELLLISPALEHFAPLTMVGDTV